MLHRLNLALVLIVLFLFVVGILMVFNTTAAEVLDRSLDKNIHHAFFKQMGFAVVAFGGAGAIFFLGYQNLLKLSGILLFFATLFLILVFVPKVGLQINGAHRWINLFGNSLQPSEFVKYLLPLYVIEKIVHRSKERLKLKAFIRLIAMLVIPIGLILIEPDNGTVAIILVTLLVLFILMKIRWIYWVVPLGCVLLVGGIVASQMSHVPNRIKIYLHPELDLQGKGHQPHQARIAAGSGGFMGRGFGKSLQKMNYLPEARSDYIAAIFAEEFGFIGILGLIGAYLAIAWLGWAMAMRAVTLEGFYLIAIFTFLICFQAFLNLGVVSGLLPSKGTNLPFFSHGGSSLLANFMAVGLILNVASRREA